MDGMVGGYGVGQRHLILEGDRIGNSHNNSHHVQIVNFVKVGNVSPGIS
jgi:hypothetical protein